MLASLALLLLFSSTTGAPSVTPAPQLRPLTLCSAISQSQVELAVGRKLEAAAPEYSRLTSTCDYTSNETAVRIAVQHLIEPLDLATEIATLKAAFPGSVLAAVEGLGTRAMVLSIPDAGIQLHVLRGDREYLLVSVMGAGNAQHTFEAAAEIARALLRR